MRVTTTSNRRSLPIHMITQNPQACIAEDVRNRIYSHLLPTLPSGDYVTLHEDLDARLESLVTHSLQQAFETLDATFKDSRERRAHYYTKGKRPRTIMTIQGESRFERDYYDPLVKADLLKESSKRSYARAGRVVGEKIGRRGGMDQAFHHRPSSQQGDGGHLRPRPFPHGPGHQPHHAAPQHPIASENVCAPGGEEAFS